MATRRKKARAQTSSERVLFLFVVALWESTHRLICIASSRWSIHTNYYAFAMLFLLSLYVLNSREKLDQRIEC